MFHLNMLSKSGFLTAFIITFRTRILDSEMLNIFVLSKIRQFSGGIIAFITGMPHAEVFVSFVLVKVGLGSGGKLTLVTLNLFYIVSHFRLTILKHDNVSLHVFGQMAFFCSDKVTLITGIANTLVNALLVLL